MVFFNALSGSFAYYRLKRIDYRSGVYFAVATTPGAILGAVGTSYMPRHAFNLLFGLIMMAAGALLWMSAGRSGGGLAERASGAHNGEAQKGWAVRDFTDAEGVRHRYSYKPAIGIVLSLFVGFLSSFLGVGGGFIHVPILTHFLDFPVHVAATSHFARYDDAHGDASPPRFRNLCARRSANHMLGYWCRYGSSTWSSSLRQVNGVWIMRGLAGSLVLVGLRLY